MINPYEILIHLRTKRFNTEGDLYEMWDTETVGVPIYMHKQFELYYLRLGQSNPHLLHIFVQLLTRGKIKVEFKHQIERLSLINKKNKITRNEAVIIFEQLLNNYQFQFEKQLDEMVETQKIVLHDHCKSH